MSGDPPPDGRFEVEIAPPSDRPRSVIDAQPESPTAIDKAFASTLDGALAHDGKTDDEILEEAHAAGLEAVGAAIVVGLIVASHSHGDETGREDGPYVAEHHPGDHGSD